MICIVYKTFRVNSNKISVNNSYSVKEELKELKRLMKIIIKTALTEGMKVNTAIAGHNLTNETVKQHKQNKCY